MHTLGNIDLRDYSGIKKVVIVYFIILKLVNSTTKSSVDGVDSFPVDVNNIDTRSNATGLVAGYTEYCDVDGGEPAAACKFTEDSNTNSLVIEDFNSCNISSKYITADNVVSKFLYFLIRLSCLIY